jgi:hypothetical protein
MRNTAVARATSYSSTKFGNDNIRPVIRGLTVSVTICIINAKPKLCGYGAGWNFDNLQLEIVNLSTTHGQLLKSPRFGFMRLM